MKAGFGLATILVASWDNRGNQLNEVDVVELAGDLTSGEVVGSITSDAFDVPTTVARHGNRLVLVNARFGITDPPNADFDLVQVPIR